ncbi:ACP S-malonyltransferase [Kitasatospora sp. LaBMicrA B282]|uniref:ACP S-malonyltransferase n=1 Tax=Kitasatospora sp. LaBMicrA B282 TaxID=3420949 RepID=UPI003D0E0CB6
MALAYLLGGGLSPESRAGVALHQAYPAVRRCYQELQELTGLTQDQLLTDELPEESGQRQSISAIRQAAVAFGIHDVLAEAGVHPAVIGGLSLGGLVGGCLTGAVSRFELYGLLGRLRGIPEVPAGAPAEGIALAFIPAGEDPRGYYGGARADVYLACDFGPTVDGGKRMLMLTGHREALDEMEEELPPGTMAVLDEIESAIHCPLARSAADHLAPFVDALRIDDPRIPLCSSLEPRTLTAAGDIRDLMHRNPVEPVSILHVISELERHGTTLALVLGPSIPEGIIPFPFPVVHITEPEHVEKALAAVREHGLDTAAG